MLVLALSLGDCRRRPSSSLNHCALRNPALSEMAPGKRRSASGAAAQEAWIDAIINQIMLDYVIRPDVEMRLEEVVHKFKERLGDKRILLSRYITCLERNYKVELALKRAKLYEHLDLEPFHNQVQVRRTEARLYKSFFEDIVYLADDRFVSFATGNKKALGSLCERDYFALAFFQLLVVSRSALDSTLCLFISGISSAGKSTLVKPLSHHFRVICVQPGAEIWLFKMPESLVY